MEKDVKYLVLDDEILAGEYLATLILSMDIFIFAAYQILLALQVSRIQRCNLGGNSPGFARSGDWESFHPRAYMRDAVVFFWVAHKYGS